MAQTPKPIDKITSSPRFKSFMRSLTVIAVLLIVAGAVLKAKAMEEGTTLLIMGFGMLAIVAFFLGNLFPCPYHCGIGLWKFAMTLTGYASAVVILGILFIVMHWPGGSNMLIIGLVSLAISAIAWLFFLRYYKKHSNDQIFEDNTENQNS
ncbi:MAG: hypothetical protein K5918_04655 [Bacteroidales bacterium]|nr:hypothetical protein [Bacteroidales bacterium]